MGNFAPRIRRIRLLLLTINLTVMKKIQFADILKPGESLVAFTVDATNPAVQQRLDDTKQKQEELLKLKEIDHDQLKQIIQL
jgi:hypothetical protein